jgi:hypothetical protein
VSGVFLKDDLVSLWRLALWQQLIAAPTLDFCSNSGGGYPLSGSRPPQWRAVRRV